MTTRLSPKFPDQAKCKCQHCNEVLEFSPSEFPPGTTIACPYCGMETSLFIPMAGTQGKARPNKRLLLTIAVFVALALLAFAAYKIVKAGQTEQAAEAVGVAGFGIIWIIGAVIGFLIAVLWIIFPVFVYFGINRLERLLQKIEVNTRKTP